MPHYNDNYGNSRKNSGENKMPKRGQRKEHYDKSKAKKDSNYYRPRDSY